MPIKQTWHRVKDRHKEREGCGILTVCKKQNKHQKAKERAPKAAASSPKGKAGVYLALPFHAQTPKPADQTAHLAHQKPGFLFERDFKTLKNQSRHMRLKYMKAEGQSTSCTSTHRCIPARKPGGFGLQNLWLLVIMVIGHLKENKTQFC